MKSDFLHRWVLLKLCFVLLILPLEAEQSAHGKDDQDLYQQSVAAMHSGDNRAALNLLNLAIKANGNDFDARFRRALLLRKSNADNLALADWNVVLKQKRQPLRALYERAQCYEHLHELDRALADANVLFKYAPRSKLTLKLRMQIFKDRGDNEAADADHAELKRVRDAIAGMHHFDAGNASSALVKARLDALLSKDPEERFLLYWRARNSLQMKDYKSAVLNFSKIIDTDPDMTLSESYFMLTEDELRFSRATANRQLGNLDKAIADYDAIIKLAPDAEEAFRERADCKMEAKLYAQAVQDYSTVLHTAEAPSGTYLARAKAYDALGKHDLAQKDRAAARQQ